MPDDHDDETLLATFDLKQRGWTASMIQKLLPQHDDTRENRLNKKYGRVKLYRESRVQDAESTGAYAELLDKAIEASERAEKARQTRARKRERQIREFLEDFDPVIVPISQTEQEALSASMTRRLKQLWETHEMILSQQLSRMQVLGKMTREERKKVTAALKERYLEALQEAYPDLKVPEAEPASEDEDW
ncbi:hypothetical protein [Deinococcus cellulosilyticus]|uniref:Uncharacterized protein n=1 Tax=Deinococcus cellulosilyticus (strain DSM 18568 / NBRC 106333 / KACC 11606 / 5516J-15) TaxID=1223518 RepID=A0A511N401_DEIC1|nr:hypothetical protein [Deinococcus cellulosilyticus]GEM47555.1 hypothetical protein DC3_31900 [Deinococcus cellulosilyticus NBRC 106333 = KACC 11606]